MTIEFKPSKDLALIGLIGLIKKLGFSYATGGYGNGLRAGKYDWQRQNEDLFKVTCSIRDTWGKQSTAALLKQAADKLLAVGEALIDYGLAVEVELNDKGEPRLLIVGAYDNKAELDAYRARIRAQQREDAKVTPEEKQRQIAEATKKLAQARIDARKALETLVKLTTDGFDEIRLALDVKDGARAEQLAAALNKDVTERYTQNPSFYRLQATMHDVTYAEQRLRHAEELELK